MKIMILMGQRQCSYPGEYQPEALQVMDEHCYSDNPDFLETHKEASKATRKPASRVCSSLRFRRYLDSEGAISALM